jgi:outer membrane protein TolC
MRWIVFAFIATFSFTHAPAQDTAVLQRAALVQDSLTIEQAIATALQNNYDIELARNDSAIAAIDYSYRNVALLPQLNANGGVLYNNNNQNITLADGTKRNRSGLRTNNTNAVVGLDWVVFDGFKMFVTRTKAAEFLNLGNLVIKDQINNTVADVILNYYNIVRYTLQLRVVEEQIALNEDRYRLAKYRFEIGVGVKPEMLQAQIDLNAQRGIRLSQLVLVERYRQDLNRLMNIAPETAYKVSDTIPVQMDLLLPQLQSVIEESSMPLRLARKNIDIAALTVRERRAERLPVISLNSAYNFTKNENNSVINPAQPLSSLNKGFNYGISASVPLFNRFNTRRLVRQAEQSVAFQQTVYQNQRSLVTTGLLAAFTTYQLQKELVVLEESNIELARENQFIARERYRLAATTFLELREAQRSLQEAYDRLISARYNMKVAETELLRLKGGFVQ